MKIPTGNFGFATPGVAPAADTSALGEGVARLGYGLTEYALEQHEQRTALARAKAANSLIEHRATVDDQVQNLQDKIASGEVPYEQARKVYDQTVAKIPRPAIDYLDKVGAEGLDRGLKQNALAGGLVVDRLVHQARKQDFGTQWDLARDQSGKAAGAPGADIESVNKQLEAFVPVAQAGGLPHDLIVRQLQDTRDQNWLNQAQQRAAESRDSIDGLQSIEHDLVDAHGFYAGKLDTNKRNAVLASVLSRRDALQNSLRAAADRQEAKGERAMNAIERQIASGVPATPQMWSTWASTVKGTSVEPDFQNMVAEEQQVQTVLRQPVADQLTYVQQQEQKLLQGGGSVREAANLSRLRDAVKANVNLLQQAPLLFNQNRTGADVQPIDLADFGNAYGEAKIGAQLQDRVATLTAMRKEYGDQVQLRPLLPQEAQVLGSVLNNATPSQAAQLFGQLRNAVGDDQSYAAVMQQIAPDSPVKALAGELAAKQRDLTMVKHWFQPNELASSVDVSTTMLEGEAILNPSKIAKAADGTPKLGLYLPNGASTTLQEKFQSVIGTVFARRPGSAETAFQAVQAYYVGKAAQSGRIAADAKDVDDKIVRDAVRATLGDVVNYNGRGSVLAPWGMDASAFEDKALVALRAAFPAASVEQLSKLGLMNRGESTYYVTSGRTPMHDANGKPILISITGASISGAGF